jgi:hypothetical protein
MIAAPVVDWYRGAYPDAVTAVYFWQAGQLQNLLDASILYNLTYSSVRLSATSPLQFGFVALGASLWIAMTGWVLAVLQLRGPAPTRWLSVLLSIGWLMVIFLSDPARRNYIHYYMNWLPFMGLLGGLAFHFARTRIFPRLTDTPTARSAGLSAALALTIYFFVWNNGLGDYRRIIERLGEWDTTRGETRTLSRCMNEHTCRGDGPVLGAPIRVRTSCPARSPSGSFYPLFVPSISQLR